MTIGHAAQLEQAKQRLASVQVLAAIDEVVGDEQHLRGHQTVRAERARCTCSIRRLWPAAEIACSVGMSVGRADMPERGDAGGDRAGDDEDDLVAGDAQGCQLLAQRVDHLLVDHAQRRR